MIKVCTEYGKSFECLYPDIWVYKRFPHYYCTWKCYRKEHNEMARLKKDGTPAKKPGPKKNSTVVDTVPAVKLSGPIRIETPEANQVKVVETPEKISAAVIKQKVVDVMDQLEIRNPLVYEGMVVREIEGQFGRYRHSAVGDKVYIDFESIDRLDVLSMTVEQWRNFREEQKKAGRILGVEL